MKILITGIAGTWGKAFTHLLKDEHKLVGIDNSEIAVVRFRAEFPEVDIILGDFGEFSFARKKFDLVIHLAAYKHIDLIEKNVCSAIENNVAKTACLFKNASRHKVEILFISTDKAVEPVSVYGMTKALGERLTLSCGGVVARSGNIEGSTGSVVNIWEEAIEGGKPLTVTDMNMVRYFIKVEDAVRVTWEGYLSGKKLIIVDIGGPQKLGDVIERILNKHGYTKETYKPGIKIIGMRPGERLEDKIMWNYENSLSGQH